LGDAIVAAIFSGLQSLNVPVTVDVGDHCFEAAATAGGTCHTQMVRHFMAQRASYSGKLLPTMGNHEGCVADAATTGNCTAPYTSYILQDFLNDVVQPSTGQSSPYYSVVLYGSWGTAKFIHVAANAWNSTQNTWVANSLAVATTYTCCPSTRRRRKKPRYGIREEAASAAEVRGLCKRLWARGFRQRARQGHGARGARLENRYRANVVALP
jgi:hypothetical protein